MTVPQPLKDIHQIFQVIEVNWLKNSYPAFFTRERLHEFYESLVMKGLANDFYAMSWTYSDRDD